MNPVLRFYLGLAARLALRFKQYDRALELRAELERAAPAGSAQAAAEVMAQGHLWGLKGDRARARAEYERALAIDPGLATAHFNVGWVCDQQGQAEEALAHFGRALAINPDLDRAWYGSGLIHVRAGRHHEAKRAFQEVVRIEPLNMHGWYQLGMTHYVLGEHAELEGLKRHTVKFNPKIAYLLDHDTRTLKRQMDTAAGDAPREVPAAPA